jgi:hypothetical protein
MPVADSEIIFGAYTEYGGLRFALFLLAEYAGIVVLCALTTVLFLGGWHGPFADELGWVWTLAKTMALSFLVIWLRVAYPRLREDQLQRLAWQVLVPVALAQLALTGVVRVATHDRRRLTRPATSSNGSSATCGTPAGSAACTSSLREGRHGGARLARRPAPVVPGPAATTSWTRWSRATALRCGGPRRGRRKAPSGWCPPRAARRSGRARRSSG